MRGCIAITHTASVRIDEGVVDIRDGEIVSYRERPEIEVPVTTGAYLFDAAALREHLDGGRCDMPTLIQRLIPEGVKSQHHEGFWIDAGTPERLRAASSWRQGGAPLTLAR